MGRSLAASHIACPIPPGRPQAPTPARTRCLDCAPGSTHAVTVRPAPMRPTSAPRWWGVWTRIRTRQALPCRTTRPSAWCVSSSAPPMDCEIVRRCVSASSTVSCRSYSCALKRHAHQLSGSSTARKNHAMHPTVHRGQSGVKGRKSRTARPATEPPTPRRYVGDPHRRLFDPRHRSDWPPAGTLRTRPCGPGRVPRHGGEAKQRSADPGQENGEPGVDGAQGRVVRDDHGTPLWDERRYPPVRGPYGRTPPVIECGHPASHAVTPRIASAVIAGRPAHPPS